MVHESTSAVAIEALHEGVRIAGSQTAFGRMIGVTQQAVSKMLRHRVPLAAEYVPLAVKGTGIPAERWRPDIFVAPQHTPAAPPLIEQPQS